MRPEDNFMKTPALRAQGIARGVLRLLQAHDFSGLQEMSLGNGRRADIVALGRDGEIRIIEIKSSVADFRSDSKWPDYQPFCDRMYFAVAEEFPQALIPADTGLIVADPYGGAIIREAPEQKLAAARRKAICLRFARLAASRLLDQDLKLRLDSSSGDA
jgi:hypothetical protein